MLINCGKCGAKCGAFTLKCGSLSCIFITRITSHSAEDMFFLNEADSDLGVITSKHNVLKGEVKEKEQPFLIALSL